MGTHSTVSIHSRGSTAYESHDHRSNYAGTSVSFEVHGAVRHRAHSILSSGFGDDDEVDVPECE